MADRSAAQLVEIRLVELKRVDASYFQDYAKVHERLERRLDKEPRPLAPQTVSDVADELVVGCRRSPPKTIPTINSPSSSASGSAISAPSSSWSIPIFLRTKWR